MGIEWIFYCGLYARSGTRLPLLGLEPLHALGNGLRGDSAAYRYRPAHGLGDVQRDDDHSGAGVCTSGSSPAHAALMGLAIAAAEAVASRQPGGTTNGVIAVTSITSAARAV